MIECYIVGSVDLYAKCHVRQHFSHIDSINLFLQLILGASIRLARNQEADNKKSAAIPNNHQSNNNAPVSHAPCTKPDYLEHDNVRYNAANTLLLDNDNDAVMME